VQLSADGSVVQELSYEGQGCSISQASARCLHDLVAGQPVTDAIAVGDEFQRMIGGAVTVEPDEDVLGDGIAFAGVAKYPARVEMRTAGVDGIQGRDRAGRFRGRRGRRRLDFDIDGGNRMSDENHKRQPLSGPRAELDDVEGSSQRRRRPRAGHQRRRSWSGLWDSRRRRDTATVDMTLTSAACPLTDVIEDQVREALVSGPTGLVNDFRINWVWMPPWGPDKITDDGRDQLRALGFNV